MSIESDRDNLKHAVPGLKKLVGRLDRYVKAQNWQLAYREALVLEIETNSVLKWAASCDLQARLKGK